MSTAYRVYTIPRRLKGQRMYLHASDELFSTESNFYPHKSISVHKMLENVPWRQFIVCTRQPIERILSLWEQAVQKSTYGLRGEFLSTELNFYPHCRIIIYIL